MRCLVYGLFTTASDEIRYVGQTTRALGVRHEQHLRDARCKAGPVARWIREEWRARHGVLARVLCPDAEWNVDEPRIIAELRQGGAQLVNYQKGGGSGALKAAANRKAAHVARWLMTVDDLAPGMMAGSVGLDGRKDLTKPAE